VPVQPIAAARSARILHGALLLGFIIVGGVFVFVVRSGGPLFPNSPVLGYLTAGLGLVNLTVATAFLAPRIPQRRVDQAFDDYWSASEVRAAAIIVWAIVEGAGLISWVGYFLTGDFVPAAVGLLAIGALILLRPGRFENA
jgi:hypothetical protein